MNLKKALCTVAFAIVLLAASSHAQTIPADHASTSVTHTLAVERPAALYLFFRQATLSWTVPCELRRVLWLDRCSCIFRRLALRCV